jgi:hypothetical protein
MTQAPVLAPVPQAPLVDRATGEVTVGRWDGPLLDPNLEDARIAHALSSFAGKPLLGKLEAGFRSSWRLKIWQYMSIVTDGWLMAVVVADAGFARNGFFYAIDTATGEVRHRASIRAGRGGVAVARTTAGDSEHRFRGRGLDLYVVNRDGARTIALSGKGEFEKHGGSFELELTLDSGGGEHLGLCVPMPTGRWDYTHKFGAYRVRGRALIDGRVIELDPKRSFGTMDYSKMYALRHAVWRWVAVCGRSKQGAVIGVNLVDPTPEAAVSENAAWIDGRLEPLSEVKLEVAGAPGAVPEMGTWRCRSGELDLTMQPIACFVQKLHLPMLRHRLVHGAGRFSGQLTTASGAVHDFVDAVGIAEDNDTWW